MFLRTIVYRDCSLFWFWFVYSSGYIIQTLNMEIETRIFLLSDFWFCMLLERLLLQMVDRLHEFTGLRYHPLELTCSLLPLKPLLSQKPLFPQMPQRVSQEAPQAFHCFLCIQTMLLDTCGIERQHKYSILILNICELRFELFDNDVFLQYLDTLNRK